MNRVIASIRGHSVIGPAVDVEGRALGRVDIGAAPFVLEVASRLRCRPLLVERTPIPRQLCRLLPCKKARISVVVVPQPLAGLAAQRIIRLSLGRQGKDVPLLAAIRSLSENVPSEVVFVPTRLDEHYAPTWSQPR